MGLTDLVAPISSSDGDDVLLGNLETLGNGDLDFLGALDSDSDVSVLVSNNEDSLESGSLSSLSLLLDGGNLHDLIDEILSNELINNLVLLDGERMSEDLLKGLNLLGLDKSSKLGDWDPFLFESTSSASLLASFGSEASLVSVSSLLSGSCWCCWCCCC